MNNQTLRLRHRVGLTRTTFVNRFGFCDPRFFKVWDCPNAKKCHIMHYYPKSHKYKDMAIWQSFFDSCLWALALLSVVSKMKDLKAVKKKHYLLKSLFLNFRMYLNLMESSLNINSMIQESKGSIWSSCSSYRELFWSARLACYVHGGLVHGCENMHEHQTFTQFIF